MRPIPTYLKKPTRFWANVKLISEQAGYSIRTRGGDKALKRYTFEDIVRVYKNEELDTVFVNTEKAFFEDVLGYMNYRAEIITTYAQPLFMDREAARVEYLALREKLKYVRPETMNKQKGEKRHPAYLASM